MKDMEEFILAVISSLPKTVLIIMSVGFVALVAWLVYFVSKRTSAVLAAITAMLSKLEVTVEGLKTNQEWLKLNQENTTKWLLRHDEDIKNILLQNRKK